MKYASTFIVALVLAGAALADTPRAADDAQMAKHRAGIGDNAGALKSWTAAIAKDPNHCNWWLERVRAQFALGDYKQAIATLEHVLKFNPGDVAATQLMVNCYNGLKDYKKAVSWANKELEIDPADGGILLLRANLLSQLGKHEQAKADLEAMKRYGFDASTFDTFQKVHSPFGIDHPAWSIQLVTMQIKKQPRCALMYYELAVKYREASLYGHDDPRRPAEMCCKVAPPGGAMWRLGHALLGSLCMDKGQYPGAIQEYSLALSDFPTAKNGKSMRGKVSVNAVTLGLEGRSSAWAATKKFENAVADMTLLINNHCPEFQDYRARGNYNWHANHIKEALADFEHAISLAPENADTHLDRLKMLRDLKRYDDAIVEATWLIKRSPHDEMLFDQRARIYMDAKHYDKALEDYSKLIELDPSESKVYLSRAAVYRQLGNERMASQDEAKSRQLPCASAEPIEQFTSSAIQVRFCYSRWNHILICLHRFVRATHGVAAGTALESHGQLLAQIRCSRDSDSKTLS